MKTIISQLLHMQQTTHSFIKNGTAIFRQALYNRL